jgi:ABC-type Fe3+-hydroxamate transport system substrate-binding protein
LEFIDQLNRKVIIDSYQNRIVSVVPSQTELLYDLGLEDKIVGQTIFCVHPKSAFKEAEKVGGTKKLNLDKIFELKPDLIIANKEENEKDQIEQMAEHFPVWISDVNSVNDALSMIDSLGKLTNTVTNSSTLIQEIERNRRQFLLQSKKVRKVVYVIWQNPMIVVGQSTFINAMLEEAGFENSIKTDRYPEIIIDDIIELQPDFVFLSSEPFPFKNSHLKAFDEALDRKCSMLVDGEMFSWYGSRLRLSFDYFEKLLRQINTDLKV